MDTADIKEYLNRAQGWYNRAISEKDDFVKFVFLYISLEVLVGIKGFLHVRYLKQNQELLKKIETRELQKLIDELDKDPLKNEDPYLNKSDKRYEWDGKIKNTDDWIGVIDFLITARNNLFHGDKGLNNKRDIFIVTWGNKLLKPIIQELIEEVRITKNL